MTARKIQPTEGIVFRQLKFRESSLIVDLFTLDWGLQSFVIHGVHKKGDSRLASALQLMHIVALQAYYHEHKTLHRIKELHEAYVYRRTPFELQRSAMGLFMLEVCRKCIRDHAKHEALYVFIKNQLVQLDNMPVLHPDFHLSFCLHLLKLLGFQLENNYTPTNCYFDISTGKFSNDFAQNPYAVGEKTSWLLQALMADDPTFKLNNAQRRDVLQTLMQYFRFHVENFGQVQSVAIYQNIL